MAKGTQNIFILCQSREIGQAFELIMLTQGWVISNVIVSIERILWKIADFWNNKSAVYWGLMQ